MIKKKWTAAVCAAIVLLFGGLLQFKTVTADAKEVKRADKTSISQDNMQNILISFDYGFNHSTKLNRNMRIQAEINNLGDDFTGDLQVVLYGSGEDNIMYKKSFQLAKGESGTIEFAVPVVQVQPQFLYRITDKSGQEIIEDLNDLKIEYSGLMVGILSDDISSLNYIKKDYSNIYKLDQQIFPEDSLLLDSLDMIILNNFNTKLLNDKQYKALQEWVKSGGSLVIGTGASAEKTLSGLTSDFIKGSVGEVREKATSFGLTLQDIVHVKNDQLFYDMAEYQDIMASNLEAQLRIESVENSSKEDKIIKPMEESSYEITNEEQKKEAENKLENTTSRKQLGTITKDLADITLQDSVVILEEDGLPVMQKIDLGLGNVLVYSVDLSLDKEYMESLGTPLFNSLYKNLGYSKKVQLETEVGDSGYYYSLINSLGYIDSVKKPSTWNYILILAVYILIVGPILYLILKKKDKRNLTWVLVPVLSLAFSGVIYIAGSKTRINEPFGGYLNIAESDENGKIHETNYFSITAPSNKKYHVSIDERAQIMPITLNGNYYKMLYLQTSNKKDYKISIEQDTEASNITFDGLSAYESNYFKGYTDYEMEKSIDSDITNYQGEINGTVTNHTNNDFTNSFLIIDNKVIYIGDLKSGESYTIDENDYTSFYLVDDLNSSEVFEKIMGIHEEDMKKPAYSQKFYAFQHIIDNKSRFINENNTLIAFSDNELSDNFINRMNLKKYGTSMLIHPLNVSRIHEGKEYIANIDPYMIVEDGYFDDLNRYIGSDILTVSYQFGLDKIQAIQYTEDKNPEFNVEQRYGFTGEIYFYNVITNKYDLVFTSRKAGSIDDLTSYLNQYNSLKVKYIVNQSDLSDSSATLPVLTAIKEAE